MPPRHAAQRGARFPGNPNLQPWVAGGGYPDPDGVRPEFNINRSQTLPGVYDAAPPGFWSTEQKQIRFVTPAEAVARGNTTLFADVYQQPGSTGIQSRGLWESEVFDTMPHLRGSVDTPDAAPLWVPGTKMVVQVFGFDRITDTTMMQVGYVEWSTPMRRTELKASGLKTDITQSFFNAPGSDGATSLVFFPPDSARYWQIVLVFDNYKATKPTGAGIQITACAAQ